MGKNPMTKRFRTSSIMGFFQITPQAALISLVMLWKVLENNTKIVLSRGLLSLLSPRKQRLTLGLIMCHLMSLVSPSTSNCQGITINLFDHNSYTVGCNFIYVILYFILHYSNNLYLHMLDNKATVTHFTIFAAILYIDTMTQNRYAVQNLVWKLQIQSVSWQYFCL